MMNSLDFSTSHFVMTHTQKTLNKYFYLISVI